jgi:hypothetical protein
MTARVLLSWIKSTIVFNESIGLVSKSNCKELTQQFDMNGFFRKLVILILISLAGALLKLEFEYVCKIHQN